MNQLSPELLLAVAVFGVILVVALLGQAYLSRVQAARAARMMPHGDDSGEFFRPSVPDSGVFGRMDVAFEQAVSRTGMEISPAGTLAFVPGREPLRPRSGRGPYSACRR